MNLFKRFVTGLGASLGWLFLLLIVGFGVLHVLRTSNLNGISSAADWVATRSSAY